MFELFMGDTVELVSDVEKYCCTGMCTSLLLRKVDDFFIARCIAITTKSDPLGTPTAKL